MHIFIQSTIANVVIVIRHPAIVKSRVFWILIANTTVNVLLLYILLIIVLLLLLWPRLSIVIIVISD